MIIKDNPSYILLNFKSLLKNPSKKIKNNIDNIKQNFKSLSIMSIILRLLRDQKRFNKLFLFLSNFENNFFQIDRLKIKKPVFICGMARSGTTFLTHLLDSSNYFSTFKYKYLPFYKTPIFWNYVNNLFYLSKKKRQRLHGDNLQVNINSPDSFEELIWKNFLEDYSLKGYWQKVEHHETSDLPKNLDLFIKKIIYINKRNRYLSKNNNNIFRVKYLLKKYPDSKIIIVIRNPVDLAFSSAKVHFKFLKYHETIKNFSEELSELGHYEFGFQRKMFNLRGNKQLNPQNIRFKTIRSYLERYQDLLSFIIENYSNEIGDKQIVILNYDNLKKINDLSKLFQFLNIDSNEDMQNYFDNNFVLKTHKRNEKFKNKIILQEYLNLSKYSII